VLRKGFFVMPEAPGLGGIELNERGIKKHPQSPPSHNTALREDGSVAMR
jgi:hypothetical protein